MVDYIISGIDELDDKLGGGFRKSGAYLLASEKKAGKSSFIRKLLFNFVSLGNKVLLIDTEETEIDVLMSMVAVAEQKPYNKVNEQDIKKLKERVLEQNFRCIDSIETTQEFYDDKGGFDTQKLQSTIKKYIDYGFNIVVFDNVTRLGSEVSIKERMRLMATLSRYAKQFNVLIFVLGHTPSSEIDTLSRKTINEAIETGDMNLLMNTSMHIVQRPKDPYGGSVTSQFDGVLIIWRPLQYWGRVDLRGVSWLIVEQIRHAAPFNVDLWYDGENRNFLFVKEKKEQEDLDSFFNV